MPIQMRKLSHEEVAAAFPGRSQMDLSDYVEALRRFEPGDAARVERGDMSPRALKRRLGVAAKQIGIALRWAPQADAEQSLVFQVRRIPVVRQRRQGRPTTSAPA